MDPVSAVAVFVGAGFGALLRWGLGVALNPLFPSLPPGTLAANVRGGLLMCFLLGALLPFANLPPALRLALTTGFLGGLTTFSTFSAESLDLLIKQEYPWALAHTFAHVLLSLLAAWGGWFLARQAVGLLGSGGAGA
ncbi:MAG: fluoride efflux transporter CrcB [Gammaproteobacteria bacterium]